MERNQYAGFLKKDFIVIDCIGYWYSYYSIDYYKANHEKGKLEKQFSLTPIVQINPRMGNVSEPATKRFIDKDIYTHITYAEMEDDNKENAEDAYKKPSEHKIKVGDTL